MTYTADEFKNSRFATHPDGRIAARNGYGADGPWWARMPAGNWLGRSDSLMAADGWVPFPEPRPLPVEVTDEMVERGMDGWNSAEGQTFVTAIRAVLTAALAAAPTTDEDEVDPPTDPEAEVWHAQWLEAVNQREHARAFEALWKEVSRRAIKARRLTLAHMKEVARQHRECHEQRDAATARAKAAEARVAELEAMTAREHLDAAIRLGIEADDDMMDRAVRAWEDDATVAAIVTAVLTPAPARPEGAEEWGEWLSRLDYLHDETDASRVDLVVLANDLAARGVRAPEGGEER